MLKSITEGLIPEIVREAGAGGGGFCTLCIEYPVKK